MKSPSLIVSTFLSSLLVVGLASTAAQADTIRSHLRQGFPLASQHQLQRQTLVTTGQGASASRSVEGQYDAANQSYSRNLEGTRFNGDSYAASRETVKTDTGYERNVSRTNSAGETASANTSVIRDRDSKSVTKDVQATGFNGQSYSTTVTRSFGDSDS